MIRRELTDRQWQRIEKLVPGKKGDKGRAGEDNRLFVDGVLWILRTDLRGVICPMSSASGTACTLAFCAGRAKADGRIFSRPWPTIPTSNTS